MNEKQHDKLMASQNTPTSLPVWKVQSFGVLVAGMPSFGGEPGTLTWDEANQTIRFLDDTGTATLIIDVRRVTRYHFRRNGEYVIWVDDAPLYFAIRRPSAKIGKASKVVDVTNAALHDALDTYSDHASSIMQLKAFIDKHNPSVVGIASMRSKTSIILALALALGLLTAGVVIALRSPAPHANSTAPIFTFTQDKAPGWYSGGNHFTKDSYKPGEYKGNTPLDKLETSGLIMSHGTDHSSEPDSCFALYGYYDYPLADISGAYKSYEASKAQGDDTTLTTVATTKQTIATPEGDVSYELRHYNLQIKGQETSMLHGYAVGFAPLHNGYIRVEGVCQTAEQINTLTSVFSAVKLTK